jgi:hypothetical protein
MIPLLLDWLPKSGLNVLKKMVGGDGIEPPTLSV